MPEVPVRPFSGIPQSRESVRHRPPRGDAVRVFGVSRRRKGEVGANVRPQADNEKPPPDLGDAVIGGV